MNRGRWILDPTKRSFRVGRTWKTVPAWILVEEDGTEDGRNVIDGMILREHDALLLRAAPELAEALRTLTTLIVERSGGVSVVGDPSAAAETLRHAVHLLNTLTGEAE